MHELTKVEVLLHKQLSDYEMRVLGEAIALCDPTAEVKVNGQVVDLEAMVSETPTWKDVWNKFDEAKEQTDD